MPDLSNQPPTRADAPRARLIGSRDLEDHFEDEVLVAPLRTSWNDFGHRLHAEVGLRTPKGGREWFGAHFVVRGHTNLAAFVREHLGDSAESIPLDALEAPFASLLHESKYYSLVRKNVGSEQGKKLLLAIHDASLLHAQDDTVPGWPEFFTSEAFTHAMTRSSEGHFAFRNGSLVLAGRGMDKTDARQSISVSLKGHGPRLHFDFDFTAQKSNALRGRIAVIIGKNGCGKTSSLSRLAAGFATDKRRGVTFENRPAVNQVLAFAHSGALVHFRQRKDRSSAASVRTFALDPSTTLRTAARERQTRLLVDIARSVDGHFNPLDDFQEIVAEEFPALKLLVPLRADLEQPPQGEILHDGGRYVDLQRWMLGGEARQLAAASGVDHERELVFLDARGQPRNLSLGQAAFLNFALNALANAGPASILLVDEPENFLHPNLVSRFMRVLHRVVEGTRSIAILATHSPFVVREVQSAQVHVIRSLVDQESEIVHPRLQTLGANVTSISNEVFGDDLAEHLYELVLKESDISNMPVKRILERFADELSTEALMFLRRRSQGNNGVLPQ